jgi:hypothetical protein
MSFPISRYRTRSDTDVSELFHYRWQGDGYATDRTIGGWKSFRRLDNITDVVNVPKAQRVKPVIHNSLVYDGLPYQPFPADHGLMVIPQNGVLPFIDAAEFESDVFSLSHTLRVQACGRAFTRFADRFPTKISGAEFVQGLFELAALLPKLERTLTQTIASGFLTKKFGWDNLLSDLRGFANLAGSIRERMEFLKRTYGKPTKLYYREPRIQTLDSWTRTYTPVRGFGTRLTLKSYQCDFTAGATLLQKLGHIDDFIGWLRAIVISLGLNNPLAAIWKTSRLSFVVDWFADVSGHLARLAAVQPADQWDVSNISHSMSMQARFAVHQVNEHIDDGVDSDIFLGTLTVKRYVRFVGLPLDLSIFTPSSATPDQLVLMIAMGAAK